MQPLHVRPRTEQRANAVLAFAFVGTDAGVHDLVAAFQDVDDDRKRTAVSPQFAAHND